MSYYIYFISEDRKGNTPVKIGYSEDPKKRLKSLQTGNPNKLKLGISRPYETEKEARLMEKCLHNIGRKKFRKLKGEWFIIYGHWAKLIEQAQKMVDGIMKHNPPSK